jgi:hypothetical protein
MRETSSNVAQGSFDVLPERPRDADGYNPSVELLGEPAKCG